MDLGRLLNEFGVGDDTSDDDSDEKQSKRNMTLPQGEADQETWVLVEKSNPNNHGNKQNDEEAPTPTTPNSPESKPPSPGAEKSLGSPLTIKSLLHSSKTRTDSWKKWAHRRFGSEGYHLGDLTRRFLNIGHADYRAYSDPGDEEDQEDVFVFGFIPFEDLEVVREIGSGSFSTVYEVIYHSTTLAAKLLDHRGKTDENQREALKHEVKILSKLDHPNIVKLEGACSMGEKLCLCTEYSEFGSLAKFIHTDHKPYSLGAVYRWGQDIATAMRFIHHKGILHRDLKSANVLLFLRPDIGNVIDRNDDALFSQLTAKICDFGLALEGRGDNEGTAGTFRWMAPEVMAGKPCTVQSDIYAFGMVLYEIGARQIPFSNFKESAAVIFAVAGKKNRPPIPQGFPVLLSGITRSCWSHFPDQRLSMDDIIDILSYGRDGPGNGSMLIWDAETGMIRKSDPASASESSNSTVGPSQNSDSAGEGKATRSEEDESHLLQVEDKSEPTAASSSPSSSGKCLISISMSEAAILPSEVGPDKGSESIMRARDLHVSQQSWRCEIAAKLDEMSLEIGSKGSLLQQIERHQQQQGSIFVGEEGGMANQKVLQGVSTEARHRITPQINGPGERRNSVEVEALDLAIQLAMPHLAAPSSSIPPVWNPEVSRELSSSTVVGDNSQASLSSSQPYTPRPE
eukprot:m.115429 g.115429  ORF g.115429 m.115429 type:complete len:683 (+) comp14203_c0_seq3:185-2233(+)